MAVLNAVVVKVEKPNNIRQEPVKTNQIVYRKCEENSNTESAYDRQARLIFNMKLIFAVLVVILAIVLIMTYFIFTTKRCNQSFSDSGLRIVYRDEWLTPPAKYPADPIGPINAIDPKDSYNPTEPTDSINPTDAIDLIAKPNSQVQRVIIEHTATKICTSQPECTVLLIEQIQIITRDLDNIPVSYFVSGDGVVYEGCGWNLQGAHSKGYNVDSILVAFIGTFEEEAPPEIQLNATKLIIDEGVKQNIIARDYRVYGARQLMETQSPGISLFEIIKQWPNWSDDITYN